MRSRYELEPVRRHPRSDADGRNRRPSLVDGMSKEDFLADKRTQQAVMMSLVIIGEASARIMDRHSEFVAGNPEIPLAWHERDVQPRRPRMFRRQPRCRMGHHSNRSSGFVVAVGASVVSQFEFL